MGLLQTLANPGGFRAKRLGGFRKLIKTFIGFLRWTPAASGTYTVPSSTFRIGSVDGRYTDVFAGCRPKYRIAWSCGDYRAKREGALP